MDQPSAPSTPTSPASVAAPASAGSAQSDMAAPSAVSWRDLREWIDLVESHHGLARVRAEVDPVEELSAITLMAAQTPEAPALLFENLRDNPLGARVLSNMLGSSARRYALTVGLNPDLSLPEMISASRALLGRTLPPRWVDRATAPVNEVVLRGSDIDMTQFPVPKFWPADGGRYIGTGDITFTRDPASQRINAGVYRQMLHSADRIGLYCSPGKHGRLDREAWWEQGKPCEVVAAYGIDPALFMVGAQSYAFGESELDAAGGITGRPVELCEAETVSLPIPANAEIVIEGILEPGETMPEGPLGEFTGYYGNPRSPQPVIRVTALHYRARPIMTAALMAPYPACEIGAYYAIMRSAKIWSDLERFGVPGLCGVYAHPAAASGWGMLVVSVRQQYAGHVAQVLALAAQCPAAAYYTKWIIAVDDDVDPTDLNQVLWVMSTRCDPSADVDLLRNTLSTGLDPSKGPSDERPYGSKALINACKPHRHMHLFQKLTALRRSTYDKAISRWSEYGLPVPAPTIKVFEPEDKA